MQLRLEFPVSILAAAANVSHTNKNRMSFSRPSMLATVSSIRAAPLPFSVELPYTTVPFGNTLTYVSLVSNPTTT
jgi:hypothetical protein